MNKKNNQENIKVAGKISEIVYIKDLRETASFLEQFTNINPSKKIQFLKAYRNLFDNPNLRRFRKDPKTGKIVELNGVYKSDGFFDISKLDEDTKDILYDFRLVKKANIPLVNYNNVNVNANSIKEMIYDDELEIALNYVLELPSKEQNMVYNKLNKNVYVAEKKNDGIKLSPILYHKGSLKEYVKNIENDKTRRLCYEVNSLDDFDGDLKTILESLVTEFENIDGNLYKEHGLESVKTK